MAERKSPRRSSSSGGEARSRINIRAALYGAAFLVAAIAIWWASSVIFVIMAGLLLGAIFHYASRYLADRFSLNRTYVLLGLFFLLGAAIAGAGFWGGMSIATQFNELANAIDEQLSNLRKTLEDLGYSGGDNVTGMFPGAQGMFDSVKSVASYLISGFGNIFVIIFIAIFVSWQPNVYRRGFVSLFPPAFRSRIGEVSDEAARRMGLWALGQFFSMGVVFLATWLMLALIGMPYAFALGLQAGLLAFIPTIGPVLAGIPMVLTGLSESPQMALWGAGAYLVVQLVESNLLTPVVQRRITELPPALTLGTQILFGALFGLAGLIMAVPVLAVIMTFVGRLYVEDHLGGWADKES